MYLDNNEVNFDELPTEEDSVDLEMVQETESDEKSFEELFPEFKVTVEDMLANMYRHFVR